MIEIHNIGDERIVHYKNLRKTPAIHTRERVFVAEGKKVTKKLLESNIDVISIFALEEYFNEFKELIKVKNIPGNMQFTASKNIMKDIIGFKIHTGIMAIGKQPPESKPEELQSPLVVMNGIIDSENVGSIVRNCAAFGIKSILFDNETSSPYLRRAVRVSMGTIFDIDISKTENLSETLDFLRKERNFGIIAAELAENSVSLRDYHFPDKFAIIFGTESHGIQDNILDVCDKILHIPISKNVASLNVAASSAVFLNHISTFNR